LIKENGPLPEATVIELALKMCEILSFLHNQTPPVIHRDFTPDNLMLAKPNQLKLIDFNVAQRLESSSTRTVVGKHCYIPPEQFRGRAVVQSDLYALGGTLFYLLTGADPSPLTCSNPSTLLPQINPKLAAIVTKATDLDPIRRYLDASCVKNDLETLLVATGP
jgi:serine/threonine protein kinase